LAISPQSECLPDRHRPWRVFDPGAAAHDWNRCDADGTNRAGGVGAAAQRVASEWRDGDRFGICSRLLFEDQLQAPFAKEIERVLRGKREPTAIQDALSRYFASDWRVFCLITERELSRYRTVAIDRSAHVLQDRYIWRPWLGVFRDRVLLLSNKAAP